jgi:hypothetical protein
METVKTVDTIKSNLQTLNLFQKILNITNEIGTISKDAKNDLQNYRYATDKNYLTAIKPLLFKYKIIILPQKLTKNDLIVGVNKSGTQTHLSTIERNYLIIDTESNEQFIVPAEGQGIDTGDKAIYKALTGCRKYLLNQLFMIEMEDDPEKEKTESKKKPYNYSAYQKPRVTLPTPANNKTFDELMAELAKETNPMKIGVIKNSLSLMKDKLSAEQQAQARKLLQDKIKPNKQ